MDSYLAYQQFKARPYGMTMADRYWAAGLTVAQTLIDTSVGPSRVPTYTNLKAFAKYYPAALENRLHSTEVVEASTTSFLSNPGYTGGPHCKVCTKPIRNAFQNELICFDCWNERKLSQPERHKHRVSLPKPKPGGME